jgi:hypothetical protein
MKVKIKQNKEGLTDITLLNLTDGKILALVAMLRQGTTTLEREVAEFILHAIPADKK